MADPVQIQPTTRELILGNIIIGIIMGLAIAVSLPLSLLLLHFFPIVFGVLTAALCALSTLYLLKQFVKSAWKDPSAVPKSFVFLFFTALGIAVNGFLLYNLHAIAAGVIVTTMANYIVSTGAALMLVGAPALILVPIAVAVIALIYRQVTGVSNPSRPSVPGSVPQPSVSLDFAPSAAPTPRFVSELNRAFSADSTDTWLRRPASTVAPTFTPQAQAASQSLQQQLQQQLSAALPAGVTASELTAEEMANPQVQTMMRALEQQIVDSLPPGTMLAQPLQFTAVRLQPGQQATQPQTGAGAGRYTVEVLDSDAEEQATSRQAIGAPKLAAGRGR